MLNVHPSGVSDEAEVVTLGEEEEEGTDVKPASKNPEDDRAKSSGRQGRAALRASR